MNNHYNNLMSTDIARQGIQKSFNQSQQIKPNELLPKEAVDMKGENFLNATLSQSTEQAVGKPTQVHRSRKNWDLRSTPPNPQIEVSPWNMSTIDPDTSRRHFEIGASSNEVTA